VLGDTTDVVQTLDWVGGVLGSELTVYHLCGRSNETSLEHTVVATESRDIYYIVVGSIVRKSNCHKNSPFV
ncbi:MAG: hypothetical protein IKT27_02285, partial [Clostridia bacterium]|nr:hypothetical protein [Clostridia bacterium]